MSIQSAPRGLSFVPADVLRAMEGIHKAGFDVWVVGGAIRDHLLGEAPRDWDLATSAGPADIMKIFPRVIPVGIRHGTVQVHTRTRDIEVTSIPPGEAAILNDLARRDFTINAMALSFPEGALLDPHRGREDLEKRLIRCVGEPGARFAEDPLRIVRAARLSGVYGFSVHIGTVRAMRDGSGNLCKISGERVRDEFCKILVSAHPVEAFDLLKTTGALEELLPELPAPEHPDAVSDPGAAVYRHSLLCVVNSPERPRVRLAALLHKALAPGAGSRGEAPGMDYRKQSAAAAASRLKIWNMSNRWIEDVSLLIENRLLPCAVSWTDAELRRFIARVRPELLGDFIALARAERLAMGMADTGDVEGLHLRMREQLETASALKISDLAVGGAQIMETLGLPRGPEVGRILKKLFDLVLEQPALNTRERLLDIALRDFGNKAK